MANRLTRHLVWKSGGAPPADGQHFEAETPKSKDAEDSETLYLDVYKAPRECATYLLKIGAEVEHALMVQYLFAAWSLDAADLHDPKDADLARSWRYTILEIAKEEMGHLATVENLLTLIGGSLSFARDDYPTPAHLYPFDFELEPLTKFSLGKYVLAEMPSDAIVRRLKLTEEIDRIREAVGAGGLKVHRVGKLYDAIADLFTSPPVFAPQGPLPKPFIAAADIQAEAAAFMVQPGEWGLGYNDVLILAPANRTDALAAIKKISDQGEGSGLTKNFDQSHFGRFLKIYRAFPSEWPVRVAKNPTTDRKNQSANPIRNEDALKWAHLFNLRYRMLLMFLAHSFGIEAPSSPSARSPRGLLITWAFGEMYNLRSIAGILMGLPMGDGSGNKAGPPFEMPSSLQLAMREPDRWRLHRDLMMASEHYIEVLLGCGAGAGHERYLQGLRSANTIAIEQAIALVGA